jgi:hypothetical protein
MLQCESCDYLHNTVNGSGICKCEFTGHVFIGKAGFELNEYPCKNRSYEEFLERRAARAPKEADPLRTDPRRVHRVAGDGWKMPYLREHPLAARRRAAAARVG